MLIEIFLYANKFVSEIGDVKLPYKSAFFHVFVGSILF